MFDLTNYSNPKKVLEKAKKYLGNDVNIDFSTRKAKKYMVKNPNGKWIHFGAKGYEDFTEHNDKTRRENYLKRASAIKGNWKADKYSPNNLSIHILW